MSEFKSEALDKIFEHMEAVKEDAPKGSNLAYRRCRVALSDVAKLCKEARKDILAAMKEKKGQ